MVEELIVGPLQALFGERYFWFILSSYAVSFAVLFALLVWVLVVYRKRKRDLAKLEAAGIRRAKRQGQTVAKGA